MAGSSPATTEKSLRQKSNFASPIKPESTVHSLAQKYFAFAVGQIIARGSAIPHPHERRIAIVTDVGRGMRWTPHCATTKRIEADGEAVWA
jgi:hypothetical protein